MPLGHIIYIYFFKYYYMYMYIIVFRKPRNRLLDIIDR